jgi:hypothetical protein
LGTRVGVARRSFVRGSVLNRELSDRKRVALYGLIVGFWKYPIPDDLAEHIVADAVATVRATWDYAVDNGYESALEFYEQKMKEEGI